MWLSDEQQKKLNDLLEKMEKNRVTPAEIERFITHLLKTVEKSKGEMSSLSTENLNTIKAGIARIEELHEKQAKALDDKTDAATGEFERNLALLKGLIKKVKTIKPIDGIDGVNPDPEDVVPLVMAKIKLPEYKETVLDGRKEIVEKINTGKKKDLKIELSQIETGTFEKGILDRAVSILDSRTSFLINKINNLPSSGGTVGPGTINEIAYFDSATTIKSLTTVTYPSLTELSYVKGVTSPIQAQIDGIIAGGVADGDKGDITVSGSGTIWTIDNDAVTYAKMQNVSATSRILGRITGGAGDVEELTAANILTILGITSTATELNYTDGVTSAIQTQINGLVPYTGASSNVNLGTNSLTLTGDLGSSGSRVANAYFVNGNISSAGTLTFATTGSKNITINQGAIAFNDSTGPAKISLIGATMASEDSNKTITLPNTTGTVALLSDIPDVSGYVANTRTITVAGTANQITSSAGAQDLSANRTWTLSFPSDVIIPTVLTVPNTGLHLLDTNASHDLIIKPGSNITADRTFTLTTGDTDMIVDFTAVTDEYVLAYDTGTNTWRGVPVTASVATAVTVANEATDTTCFPLFVTAATGDLGPKTNAGLAFNSNTGLLTTTLLNTTGVNTNFGTTVAQNSYTDIGTALNVGLRLYSGTAYTDGPAFQIWEDGSSYAAMYFDAGNASGSDIFFRTNTITPGNAMVIKQNTGNVQIYTGIEPDANDGAYLGTSALGWSDLFLAEGAVINWDNGDLTLTQAGNLLTLAGGDLQTPKIGVGVAPDASRLMLVSGDVSGGVATINRTNASTNAAVGTAIIKGTSSGDMTDGFGSAFQFAIQDTAAVENLIANIQGVRDGADNSGAMLFSLYTAGVASAVMGLYKEGDLHLFGSSTQSARVYLYEDTDNGSNSVAVISPSSLAADYTITLPAATDTLVGKATTDTLTNKTIQAGIIDYVIEPASDDTYEGEVSNDLNAGDTIAQWDLVYLDSTSGRWEFADADAAATSGQVLLAMATASGTDGNPMNVIFRGIVRNDGWTWTTVGAPLYVSTTPGGITQTQPSGTDDVIRVVGYVISDDCIYFNPETDWIIHT